MSASYIVSVVYNLGKSIFTVYFTIGGEWVLAVFAKIIAASRYAHVVPGMHETRALAHAGTHVHIVEFIFIAEIAAIHSHPVIYSEERSSAPRPARTRGEKGSRGAEIESPSTSKTNIVSHETDCWPS